MSLALALDQQSAFVDDAMHAVLRAAVEGRHLRRMKLATSVMMLCRRATDELILLMNVPPLGWDSELEDDRDRAMQTWLRMSSALRRYARSAKHVDDDELERLAAVAIAEATALIPLAIGCRALLQEEHLPPVTLEQAQAAAPADPW